MSFIVKMPNLTTGLPGVDYISSYPCLSDDNDFIPVNSLVDGEILTMKGATNRSFLYQLNTPIRYYQNIGRFNQFIENLEYGSKGWVKLRRADLVDVMYYGNAGTLVNFGEDYHAKPILLMCVRTSQLWSLKKDANETEKFTLLVDNCINTPLHSKLLRNVKSYLQKVQEGGINILYTNNIESMCLCHRPVEKPKFATVTEMLGYSKTITEQVVQNLD